MKLKKTSVGRRNFLKGAAAGAAALVRFLPGRVKFGTDAAPFPSAVLVLGQLPGRHGTVARFCVWCKDWFFPARSDAKTCSQACRRALSRSRVARRKRDTKRHRKSRREAAA